MRRKLMMYACLAALVTASGSPLEAQDILTFNGNGILTWSNSNTNLFYRIEWAPTLTGTDVWRSAYSELLDIRSPNPSVTSAVPMFYRVCASSNRMLHPAPVAKTGAGDLGGYTEAAGEDGHATMRKGVAWPTPRFTDNGDGTVTDNLTGLIWLKDANAFGTRTWANALADCATLNSGEHGLTDGSVEGDWRLPNVQELQSLIDYGQSNPALPSGHPFTGVGSSFYWSATTIAGFTTVAWYVTVGYGHVDDDVKSNANYVWPVRGGQ